MGNGEYDANVKMKDRLYKKQKKRNCRDNEKSLFNTRKAIFRQQYIPVKILCNVYIFIE